MPPPHLHGRSHPALGQFDGSGSWENLISLALSQNGAGIGANSFVDILKRRALCTAAVLHRGTNNAAGVRNEIRHH